jgi:hypothetical protein
MPAKQALYRLSHTSNPFHSGYFFDDGVLCLGWPQNVILSISAFQST